MRALRHGRRQALKVGQELAPPEPWGRGSSYITLFFDEVMEALSCQSLTKMTSPGWLHRVSDGDRSPLTFLAVQNLSRRVFADFANKNERAIKIRCQNGTNPRLIYDAHTSLIASLTL